MSIQSKTQLKTYFETGDVPTQAEYIHFIDTVLIHPIVVTFNTTAQIIVGQGFMLKSLLIFSSVPVNGVKVGDSAGSGEYFEGDITDANIPVIIDMSVYAHVAPKTIHLTGGTTMSYKTYSQ